MLKAFARLIRLNNLIIILATMYLLRYLVIGTWIKVALSSWGFTPGLNDRYFFLLAISVVAIAAAGYIINDYFDISIDRVNKPGENVVGIQIGKDKALIIHFILNIIGVGLGFTVASMTGSYKLGFIHAVTAAGLWFYSASFKKELLIGNIIVALSVAMVPLIVGAFEFPLLLDSYQRIFEENEQLFTQQPELDLMIAGNLHGIGRFILIAALFAFLLTLIRELIKDLEDMEGDAAFGCKTLPLVAGMRTTKITVGSLIGITMLILAYIMIHQFPTDKISFAYFLLALFFPSGYLLYKISKAEHKEQFGLLSKVTKAIMLAGLFYTLIHNYLLRNPL